MIILNPKQIESIIKLPADKRYQHFIKRVVDQEELWGIYDSDWITIKKDDGELFPVWPNKEYAQVFLQKNFPSAFVKPIDLYEFIDTFLPELGERNIAVSVFPTPDNEGHIACYEKVIDDLNTELEKY